MKIKKFAILTLLSLVVFTSCETDDPNALEDSAVIESEDLRLSLTQADFRPFVRVINNQARVTFINTSIFASTFDWSFSGGSPESSTQRNPLIIYNENGTFSVTLTVSRGDDSDTITKEVVISGIEGDNNDNDTGNDTENNDDNDDQDLEVNAGFIASVSIINNQARVTLNNQSENADTFQWSFPGGAPSSSTLENPIVTYPQNGTFTITLVASNGTDSDTTTQTLSINDIVDNNENDDDIIDVSARFLVRVRSAGNGQRRVTLVNRSRNATDFEWSFPGGNPESSTEVNPVVIYPSTGQRIITLVARNGEFSDTRTVTLNL